MWLTLVLPWLTIWLTIGIFRLFFSASGSPQTPQTAGRSIVVWQYVKVRSENDEVEYASRQKMFQYVEHDSTGSCSCHYQKF